MRASSRVKLAALLLLALLAPLQSVLAAGWTTAPQGTHAPCPNHERHDQNAGALHTCGCCCIVAMSAAAVQFDVPRDRTSPLALPAPRAPHQLARDRLDRPPR
ncbi:MAG TPA: hypothetical protein VGI93_05025 [Steroidobacteraceae bacterium]|jgi:hypothetical protein